MVGMDASKLHETLSAASFVAGPGVGVTKRIPACAHGLRASAWALGPGTKVLTHIMQEGADGRLPSTFDRLYLG